MGKRRDSRVLALKSLYIYELVGDEAADAINDIAEIEQVNEKEIITYAQNIVSKVIMFEEIMNAVIEDCTKNWTIQRMALIDRNILRIAISEIFFQDNVPDVVAIDEAIEMAKAFSTDDSGGFVNGILDYIIKNKESFAQRFIE